MKKTKASTKREKAAHRKVAIVGCGNLGSAILRGVLEREVVRREDLLVCDAREESLSEIQTELKLNTTTDVKKAYRWADTTIFAVKPKDMAGVLAACGKGGAKIAISVAVGVSTQTIQQALGTSAQVARVIPNVASSIGLGMSSVFSESSSAAAEAMRIFNAVGLSIELHREIDLDAASAVSASGPVFLYTAIEGMIDGAVKMGLSYDTAQVLVAQTALGAGALMLESELSPSELKSKITTPGGTTIEGVAVLEKGAVRSHFLSAVEQTTLRAQAIESALTAKKNK